MYRILVASDSHGKTRYICNSVESIKYIDLIVHLGDNANDAQNIEFMYPDYAHVYVRGNCDFLSNVVDEKILDINGFRFLLTHGHVYGVKSGISNLLRYAKDNKINCVLYGHTHIKKCEWIDGILFLNPGSGNNYDKNSSIGIVEIENGKLKGCVL